jgi:hypothetical protein
MDRDEMRWRDQAACIGTEMAIMFPGVPCYDNHATDRSSRAHCDACNTPVDYSPAKAICENCPVQEPCLEYALNDPEAHIYGCWGGTSPRDRKIIRRRRNLASITVLNTTYLAIDI